MKEVIFPRSRNIEQYVFGKGSFSNLAELLDQRRAIEDGPVIYFMDHYFSGNHLSTRIPVRDGDPVIFVDTTHEPTVQMVNDQMDTVESMIDSKPSAVVGIGGGSTLDTAKAISNLLTNQGKAEDYQGWDLVRVPGIYKIGIPTISGTGAETSRTCVLTNYEKHLKLGMNSPFTIFDQLILDPELTATVPKDQYFYTGMDTFIHCIESLNGRYRHALADSYSKMALQLCSDVFQADDMLSESNREQLMVASYFGGCALANSYVGLVHPLSAALSLVLGYHHGLANCLVMNIMEEYYPEETAIFHDFLDKQSIELPTGIAEGLSADDFEQLYLSCIIHEKPLANALGDNFQTILDRDRATQLFQRM